MDEYDTLLLTAVHNADLTTIQTCLSSMADPNTYLNRVYDQPNDQKCTLLMIACLNGFEDIVYMMLDGFQPDLEILNIIQIENKDKQPEVYKDVTILWAAAAINHFPIVKRLVECGAHINHRTSTNSTAVRCACYSGNLDMARYLVENGADININKNNNETNLSLAVFCGHLQLSIYLVDELKCDINECDGDGRSALYFAVKCGSLEIVACLLQRGARHVPSTRNYMSALMLAADKRRSDIVEIMFPYCSILERIEAEELLGSAFTCAEQGPCDFQQSFEYYSRAIQLRSDHNLPKVVKKSACELFNNRQECSTMNELEEIRQDSEKMHIEALLVRERLLGTESESYHYSILYRGAILADSERYDEALTLWMYELELTRQHKISIDPEDMRQFVVLFCDMLFKSASIPIKPFLTIVATTVQEIKHDKEKIDYHLHTLLFLVTIISQSSLNTKMSSNDRKLFYRLLHSINQTPYITHEQGSSLLHLSLNEQTSGSHRYIDNICEYPCLSTVRTLLQCGADANGSDAMGNTPLHVLASNSSSCDESILGLLCDGDAHFDYTNALDETPIDIAFNSSTEALLKSKVKIRLKCICAQLIRKNKISFDEKISPSLVNFVKRH